MNPFTTRVISIIRSIPKGKIMTYGQIAYEAGNPRSARQVARILHSMSDKHDLPWHRVINANGCISLKGEGCTLQKRLLEEEGISFKEDSSINLDEYRYYYFS